MPRPEQPVARLVWVLDGEARFDPHRGPNRLAADQLVATITAMDGATGDLDGALLTAVSMLGEAVDADPTNAALWRQYRETLEAVKGLADGDDDAFGKLLAELGSPDLRDAPKSEPSDPRDAGGEGGDRPRSAADAAPGADRRRRR